MYFSSGVKGLREVDTAEEDLAVPIAGKISSERQARGLNLCPSGRETYKGKDKCDLMWNIWRHGKEKFLKKEQEHELADAQYDVSRRARVNKSASLGVIV